MTEWISLLASIGALSAAVIALFTLFELFKQRKSSYKPDLTILQRRFTLKPSEFGKVKLPLDWINPDHNSQGQSPLARVPIVNIGFGAAKNVIAKWSFDRDKLIEQVNKLAQKKHQPFYIEKQGTMLSVKNKGQACYLVNNEMDSEEFEYLLPLNQDTSSREIMLPPSYTMLVSVFLSLSSMDEFELNELNIPEINLQLSYSDIGKGKHKSKHRILCSLSFISKTEGAQEAEFGLKLLESS